MAKGKNKGKTPNPNKNPNKKKGGDSGTGTKKGDAGRERNRGIDEEHSIRPKGGVRTRILPPIIDPCILDPLICMDPCFLNPLLPECTSC